MAAVRVEDGRSKTRVPTGASRCRELPTSPPRRAGNRLQIPHREVHPPVAVVAIPEPRQSAPHHQWGDIRSPVRRQATSALCCCVKCPKQHVHPAVSRQARRSSSGPDRPETARSQDSADHTVPTAPFPAAPRQRPCRGDLRTPGQAVPSRLWLPRSSNPGGGCGDEDKKNIRNSKHPDRVDRTGEQHAAGTGTSSCFEKNLGAVDIEFGDVGPGALLAVARNMNNKITAGEHSLQSRSIKNRCGNKGFTRG